MSTQEEKDAKHAYVRTELVQSLCAHQAIFWQHVDLDEYEMSNQESDAIDLAAIMDFASLALASVDQLTKEQWMEFCTKIYERAEYEKIDVTTSEVGDA